MLTPCRWRWTRSVALGLLFNIVARNAWAGPETGIREFASSQVKKGVRALGMGGDGATIGNYALVWKDAGTAISDFGETRFSDTGNVLDFIAVGFSTPKLPGDISVFIVAMSEWGTGLHLRSPSSPSGGTYLGEASDQALFVKLGKPIGRGFSVGALFGFERSSLTGLGAADSISYTTTYRPSGGVGVTWEPNELLLLGTRVLTNQDQELRRDSSGSARGALASWEFRAGVTVFPWRGTALDLGYVGLYRSSELDQSRALTHGLTGGAEQQLFGNHLAIRAGWDETSPTIGASVRVGPLKLDAAYVRNLGVERSKGVFGEQANSVIATLTYDYAHGVGTAGATR